MVSRAERLGATHAGDCLIVLFIPSVDRDETVIDRQYYEHYAWKTFRRMTLDPKRSRAFALTRSTWAKCRMLAAALLAWLGWRPRSRSGWNRRKAVAPAGQPMSAGCCCPRCR